MYIYIAGPYRQGVPDDNVRDVIDAAEKLFQNGHTPFLPHLDFLWGIRHEHGHEFWMDWCLSWIDRCDALLRLSGESEGGDREVEYARENGKKVYHSADEILDEPKTSGEPVLDSLREVFIHAGFKRDKALRKIRDQVGDLDYQRGRADALKHVQNKIKILEGEIKDDE